MIGTNQLKPGSRVRIDGRPGVYRIINVVGLGWSRRTGWIYNARTEGPLPRPACFGSWRITEVLEEQR